MKMRSLYCKKAPAVLLVASLSSAAASTTPLLRRRNVVIVPEAETSSIHHLDHQQEERWILHEENAIRYLTDSSLSLSMPITSRPTVIPARTDPVSAPAAPPTLEPTANTVAPFLPPASTRVDPVPPPPTTEPQGEDRSEPTAACHVDVDVGCTISPGSVPCDQVDSMDVQCEARPTRLSFMYTGGDCAQSDNEQHAIATYFCQSHNGGPDTVSAVYVVAMVNVDIIYFEGYVQPGEVVALFDSGPDLKEIGGFLVVNVFSSADTSPLTRLQSVMFRANCDHPLNINDKFGAFQFASYRDGEGKNFPRLELEYQVTNLDTASAAKLQWLDTATNFGEDFLVLDEADDISLMPEEVQFFYESREIDLTAKKDFRLKSTVIAKGDGSQSCSDVEETTFITGN